MTQEEMDQLVAAGVDLDTIQEESSQSDTNNETSDENEKIHEKLDEFDGHEHKHYKDEHLVSQLHEVTSDSEQKATEIFDNLDKVLENLDAMEDESIDTKEGFENIRNVVFETMSTMQYQDIHRQKIERVINTMREISHMMNDVLDGVKPKDYVPSAKHIPGDSDTDDLVDDDELAKLIEEMGNK